MQRQLQPIRVPVVAPALTYFALVFAVGFVLGALRVAFVVPRLGVRYAELLEMPLMLAAIVFSARFVVRRFVIPSRLRDRVLVGVPALVFLITAELALAWLLQGQTPVEYAAGHDPVSGSVYAAMLVLFALMPLLVQRRP